MVLLEQGAVIAGKYRLDKPLARGGMGAVWVARHLQLDVDVAVKLMTPEYASSPEARMRFEREARASARLRSPYVVHMVDYGSAENGALFLVMELLQGEDLDARLRRTGRLTPAGAASLVDQVCKALECAHEAGLVHRDLKPANLFLARHGREETVKVLDFGIAKAMGPAPAAAATRTGTLLGSPHYMSPEQVRRSKDVDPRSDLWSLGVILFQCLTGRVPFAGDELGDVLVAICADDIPRASQISPDLGPEIDRFLSRALTRNPDQRFQSAREMAEAFARAVAMGETLIPAALPVTTGETPNPPAQPVTMAPPPAPIPDTLALPPTSPALPAPGAPATPISAATLAPSGSTLAAPPSSRLAGVIAASFVGAMLLGLAAFFVLRSPSPVAATGAASAPAEAASDAAPPLPSPVVSSTASATVAVSADPAPKEAFGPAGAPSSGLPRLGRRAPSAPPITPSPAKSPKGSHDPLEHR